jgi:hypothetical protein
VFEHRPRIELRITQHLLRGGHCEATGEYASAAEYRALICVKEIVTPIECLAQRLMTAQGSARAAGQYAKPLIQSLAHAGRP